MPTADEYAQQHLARYGFMPEANNPVYAGLLAQGGGGGSPRDGLAQALMAQQGGGGGGNAAAQAYYQQHVARYGFAPEANNPVYAQLLAQGNGQTPTPPPPPAADSAVAPMDSFGRMPNPTPGVPDYGNPPFGGSAVRSGTPDDGPPFGGSGVR